jgi:hypothetical protein
MPGKSDLDVTMRNQSPVVFPREPGHVWAAFFKWGGDVVGEMFPSGIRCSTQLNQLGPANVHINSVGSPIVAFSSVPARALVPQGKACGTLNQEGLKPRRNSRQVGGVKAIMRNGSAQSGVRARIATVFFDDATKSFRRCVPHCLGKRRLDCVHVLRNCEKN